MPISTPTISINQAMPFFGVRLDVTNPDHEEENIERNDVYRRMFGESEWMLLNSIDPDGIYIDYEAATKTNYQYIVTAINDQEETQDSTIINFSVDFNEWFIKDLDNISDSIVIFVDGDQQFDITTREEQSVFNPIGRRTSIVIKDDKVKSDRFGVTIQFTDNQSWWDFVGLREKQKTLLLQSPVERAQWYFMFGSEGRETWVNTVDAYRLFTIDIIEVDRPQIV